MSTPERLRELQQERDGLSREVESFFTGHAAPYPPLPPPEFRGMWAWPDVQGTMHLPVLVGLWGRPWNNAAANFLVCLRPSCVRVLRYGQARKTDARPWRVTVQLWADGSIKHITQEVVVGLVGFRNSRDAEDYFGGSDDSAPDE